MFDKAGKNVETEGNLRSAQGICIIMAGGRGTRFWPLSRTDRPKQLLALSSDRSLLRDTFERVAPLVGADRVLVITSGNLAAATKAELPELPPGHVITEPVGRNTAPCAMLGIGVAGRIDPHAPVALLPADHFIPDADKFRSQLADAFLIASEQQTVVTIGIVPDRPETGYGYIQVEGESFAGDAGTGLGFVEKPDRETALKYVSGGCHFWNSGIFIWNQDWFNSTANKYMPEIQQLMLPAAKAFGTESFTSELEAAYGVCPADSIDFAVMEKLTGFTVLRAGFRWSDLGSWDAWGDLAPELEYANRGKSEILAIDSKNNILLTESSKLIALVGVNDMVIVDTPDAMLVCPKADAQRIKEIITRLEADGKSELL